jgi:DNA-binding transcriptional regulator GbsR (MarR family)
MATKTPTAKNHLPSGYSELLQSVGSFIQYWGFKEVHGQIWACIFLANEPVDANHLMAQLKLSKAAVSLAIKDLSEYSVIEEVEKTRPSTRKYVSNPDLAAVILNVLRKREKHMLNEVMMAAKALSEHGKEELSKVNVAKDKLSQLKEMTQGAQLVLDQILKQDDVAMTALFGLLQSKD